MAWIAADLFSGLGPRSQGRASADLNIDGSFKPYVLP